MDALPEHLDQAGALWQFSTQRYTVALFALDEDRSPEDSFCDDRDVAFASDGDPAHWFCAAVGVYDEHGDLIARDYLGGCSYNSFCEFYSAHRWQFSRRQNKWITDPRSRAWKACNAARKGQNGTYFTDMVCEAIREARLAVALASEGSRRA